VSSYVIQPFDIYIYTFFCSIIQPDIDYGITVWGLADQYNIDKVQSVQNYLARVINCNFDYDHWT